MSNVAPRSDFHRIHRSRKETRTLDRLSAHYQIEVRLAQQLRQACRAERLRLYPEVYGQLFASLPDHPQHSGSNAVRASRVQLQAANLLKYLEPSHTYVEVGCGDASLTKVIATRVQSAIGVDVTPALVSHAAPPTFKFVQSDGVTLDLPTASADMVFSNQLMEHLHTEDAVTQLQEVHRVLKSGGVYFCCTPNRLTGPHDISVYFGHEPVGFHMREYDHRSLSTLFRSAGFSTVTAAVSLKGHTIKLPLAVVGGGEKLFEFLPSWLRSIMTLHPFVANIAGVNLIGRK